MTLEEQIMKQYIIDHGWEQMWSLDRWAKNPKSDYAGVPLKDAFLQCVKDNGDNVEDIILYRG